MTERNPLPIGTEDITAMVAGLIGEPITLQEVFEEPPGKDHYTLVTTPYGEELKLHTDLLPHEWTGISQLLQGLIGSGEQQRQARNIMNQRLAVQRLFSQSHP